MQNSYLRTSYTNSEKENQNWGEIRFNGNQMMIIKTSMKEPAHVSSMLRIKKYQLCLAVSTLLAISATVIFIIK